MRKPGGSLLERCMTRLRAALHDNGERCHRCGVCHNVGGLMGREPGWLHRSRMQAGAAAGQGRHSNDAKAQED